MKWEELPPTVRVPVPPASAPNQASEVWFHVALSVREMEPVSVPLEELALRQCLKAAVTHFDACPGLAAFDESPGVVVQFHDAVGGVGAVAEATDLEGVVVDQQIGVAGHQQLAIAAV